MEKNTAKKFIRQRYGRIADHSRQGGCCTPRESASCCSYSSSAAEKSSRMGYSAEELAAVPVEANLGLGCGNPQAIAEMKPGEVVVDLGSGAGFDCFLAARRVGPGGRVIGVDMTAEMLQKARENAATLGADTVEFRLGEIEHLPVADNSADVVISNCVINLSPDKPQVFREAYRILKPGGRLAISDVVNLTPLPETMSRDPELLCSCISGAAPVADIERWLAEAGFIGVTVELKPQRRDLIRDWLPGTGIEDMVAAAIVTANKPL